MARIIPCLDIKDGKVVKGVNFVDLKEIGCPIEFALNYEKQGADEIVLLDITATNENRGSVFSLLEKISKALSVPLTLGGGIRTVEEFGKALEHGATKVSVSSAAVANPELIRLASSKFGRERVVVAVDGKGSEVYTNGGRVNTGINIIDWVKQCEGLGAGEILFTSMDGDGVQSGYDIVPTRAVCEAVSIPVIASGGCGKIEDIISVFKETGCDAALVASILHFGKVTIPEIKDAMRKAAIS